MSSMSADAHYEQMGGPKLRLMHPVDNVKDFNYMGATGAIDV